MVRFLPPLGAAAALVASVADARTTVAVLEVGQGGVVRRTAAASPHATVTGVASFWSAVHDEVGGRVRRGSRAAQHPGMAVVPDLFSRADGGLALGITGSAVDLADMPGLSTYLEEAVGTFELAGSHGHALLRKAGTKAEDVLSNAADVASTLKTKAAGAVNNRLESMTVTVDDEKTAAEVDSSIAAVVRSLQKESAKSGKTMILHLVIDEEESGAARRRLEDQDQDENQEEEEAEEEGDEADDQNNQNKQYSDSGSGERTIFEIQYFNVVLWSAIGLTIILISAIYMMMYMPLMADTLLFGESAKVVGD